MPILVNAPPAVSLTSPAANATFTAPASIALSAEAADADGTVAAVAFYYDTTLITTLTSPPYSFTWTGVPQGSYSLTARATDDRGATTPSAAVPISVNPAAPAAQALYFIHADHLNTPRLVANAAGTAVWKWNQEEPFGNNVADENPSGLGAFDLPLRLPGQYLDKETNLHYNYFRDYDPGIGIYKQSDPIGLKGGINTYVYVNSPLLQIDPYGLMGRAPGGRQQRFPGSSCGPEHDPNSNFPSDFGAWSFEKACKKHDACYRICRKPKALCDDEFLDDMGSECDSVPPATWFGFAKNICRLAAYDYHDAAFLFGGPSYDRGQAHCRGCK